MCESGAWVMKTTDGEASPSRCQEVGDRAVGCVGGWVIGRLGRPGGGWVGGWVVRGAWVLPSPSLLQRDPVRPLHIDD